jgi:hypothetical protein
MKKNELIARLVNRKLTSSSARNLCYAASANGKLCYAAVEQRPIQAAPAK